MFFLGHTGVAAIFDGWLPGLGGLLQRFLGLMAHYEPMLRGVIALGDLAYFAALSTLFLVLNTLWLQGRKY
jgi:hypothetical protein